MKKCLSQRRERIERGLFTCKGKTGRDITKRKGIDFYCRPYLVILDAISQKSGVLFSLVMTTPNQKRFAWNDVRNGEVFCSQI